MVAAIRMRVGDLLRRDPDWKPLWNDLRFQKLIAEHLPKNG